MAAQHPFDATAEEETGLCLKGIARLMFASRSFLLASCRKSHRSCYPNALEALSKPFLKLLAAQTFNCGK